jgi:DNA-binding CsgD family transcriptional regulator
MVGVSAKADLAMGTGGSRLLERERELAVLERAITAAAAGSAGLILVEGPAGIGKSRLLIEARRRAAEGQLLVLSARGGELERDFPFGIVRQLFEARLAVDGVRARVLSGAALAAAPIFGLEAESPGDETTGEATFGSLHGLYWLTLNLSADQPLLLAVDDLHWCDRASLRFLAYLARRLEEVPVLLVGSLRPSEPGADQALLAELTSDLHADVLFPGALTAAAAAEVIRDRLGDDVEPAFAHACHASTGGNPLLLSELLKALVSDRVQPTATNVDVVADLGPRAASRAVLLRLARLSDAAVRVARSIAVLGDGAELGTVAALEGLEPEAVAAAFRELVQAEILRPEQPIGFVHPLVQAAVYRDLSVGERELHHGRAARLLVELEAPAEQVAPHVRATPPRGEPWVVDVLRAAAGAALAKGAPDAAISSLLRALDEPLPPELRADLLLELGRAELLTSLPDATGHLRDAYEGLSDPGVRALAAEGLARALVFMEVPEEAATIAHQAGQELPDGLDDLAMRLEVVEHLALFWGAREDPSRLQRLQARRTIDTTRGIGAKMLAAISAWEWTASAGPADQVTALSRAALADGELSGPRGDAVMTVVAALPLVLADQDDALDVWGLMRAEAHRSGSIFALSSVQLWNGYTQFLRGELDEAESELRASLETLTLWGLPGQSQWTSAFLAELLVERGTLAEARELLEASTPASIGSDQSVIIDRAHMRLLLAEGRPDEALAHAAEYERHARWKRHPRYAPWRSLKAQALDRLGRSDEAIALAAEELAIAREWGSPGTVGRSLRVLGAIERETGVAHLEEACALLKNAPARLEQAKALAALGGVLRRARRPTEAREPLRRALELAEICGARALMDEVRTEIYATGARPRKAALQGIGSLTASERRVADLAATGQSNRDIAQTLYVTPKTIEVHLSNSYRKLGISSRRQLAGALVST